MGEYAAEPQDRTAAEAKFSSEQLETGSTPQICCQPASRFKNETTFSLITSFLQFRYLNFFLVGHPVVRFARQENGRKYLQSSAISKCPLFFWSPRGQGLCFNCKQIFWFECQTISIIVYAGGGCAVPTRQQYTSKSLCQLSKKFLDGKVIITLASIRMPPSWCQNIRFSLIAMNDGAFIKCKGTLGCECKPIQEITIVNENLQCQTTWSHIICYEAWLLTLRNILLNCTTLCSTVPCSSLRSQFELCLWV